MEKLIKLLHKTRNFLLYEVGTLVYAAIIVLYMWVVMEFSFVVLMALIGLKFHLEEGGQAVIFGLLHSFVLFLAIYLYFKTSEALDNAKQFLEDRGIKYLHHSQYWSGVFLALFSTTVSLYILGLIVLITYAMYPKKIKGSVLLDQAVLYLILVSYFPLVFLFQKFIKSVLYLRHINKLRFVLLRKDVQKFN
ncbi:hypothetical protein [Archaeoglobus sp.]